MSTSFKIKVMNFFYSTIHRNESPKITLANAICLTQTHQKKGFPFYPDLVLDHPFCEGSLILNPDNSTDSQFLKTLSHALEQYPPHLIFVFYGRAFDDLIFKQWLETLSDTAVPSFFSAKEQELMTRLSKRLRLTKAQNDLFHRRCVRLKLTGESLQAFFEPYLQYRISEKRERNHVFRELIDD